jgi:hypothetical protein
MTASDLHTALAEILRRGQDIIDGKREPVVQPT